MKKLFALFLFQILATLIFAQNPVKWTYDAKPLGGDEYELVFTAIINDGWNIYSQHIDGEGPVPTSFEFKKAGHYQLKGSVAESGDIKEADDEIFGIKKLKKIVHKGIFKQKVKVSDPTKAIEGYLTYMTCNDKSCLPPKDVDFAFKLPSNPMPSTPSTNNTSTTPPNTKTTTVTTPPSKTETQSAKPTPNQTTKIAPIPTKDAKPVIESPKTEAQTTETAQLTDENPVAWTTTATKVTENEYDLEYKAAIKKGWYVYSQHLGSADGPVATSINYADKNNIELVGEAKESANKMEKNDPLWGFVVGKFKDYMTITQRVKVKDASKPISGYVTFMTCNDKECLPPKDIDFAFNLGGQAPTAIENKDGQGVFSSKRDINKDAFASDCSNASSGTEDKGLFSTFILSFFGGLLALLTPCVFPMLPLTVSFFTKGSKDRAKGIRNAVIYGLSIIGIYVAIGIILTSIFGPTVLNEMSTDMYFNLLFFVVFIIFAISFFGYFEITLPSSWTTKTDEVAGRGGLIGIFFMAFTLALVSFSCTGPIIGSLLVQTAQGANDTILGFIPIKPLVGMFGFSFALALPFTLFAIFPSWLSSLPRSGSWMNNVKVTLGFIELALALKFLSTADMVRHWGILKYEVFIILWMIIFLGLALYQFGFIKFPHDSPLKKLTTGRWVVGLASLCFVVYLANGLNYKQLSLLSGLAPPVHYNIWGEKSTCPHGLNCFHDFDEAVTYAKQVNKPLLVDFTGYGCVNCRKMEENVWIKPEILNLIKDKYVLASLYVDDQQRLFPEDKQKFLLDAGTGEKMRTVGAKWASFQVNNFAVSSQPYYVLMNNDGKTLLNRPVAYTPDVAEYKAFLQCGLDAFNKVQQK